MIPISYFPLGPLAREQERYRIRQGDYRIIYSVDDTAREVVVVKIGHRGEIYRQ